MKDESEIPLRRRFAGRLCAFGEKERRGRRDELKGKKEED